MRRRTKRQGKGQQQAAFILAHAALFRAPGKDQRSETPASPVMPDADSGTIPATAAGDGVKAATGSHLGSDSV